MKIIHSDDIHKNIILLIFLGQKNYISSIRESIKTKCSNLGHWPKRGAKLQHNDTGGTNTRGVDKQNGGNQIQN